LGRTQRSQSEAKLAPTEDDIRLSSADGLGGYPIVVEVGVETLEPVFFSRLGEGKIELEPAVDLSLRRVASGGEQSNVMPSLGKLSTDLFAKDFIASQNFWRIKVTNNKNAH
jgi:hypothetical protein